MDLFWLIFMVFLKILEEFQETHDGRPLSAPIANFHSLRETPKT